MSRNPAARVARAIQDVHRYGEAVGERRPTLDEWETYRATVGSLIFEIKAALHLTDDINRY